MPIHGRLEALAICLAALAVSGLQAASTSTPQPTPSPALTTQVFYLQGIKPRDAMALLRAKAQVRRIVGIDSLDLVIVRDDADTVARTKSLLQEQGAISRSVVCREPSGRDGAPDGSVETREIRLRGLAPQDAIAVLRTLYSIGDVKAAETGDSISLHATEAIQGAVEALFHDLGVAPSEDPPPKGEATDREYTQDHSRQAPKQLDPVWRVDGRWTGVSYDAATGSIYALGEHGACAEIGVSGTVKRAFTLAGADGDILRLARFKGEVKPTLLTFHIWAPQIKANDGDGKPVWSYPQGERLEVDDVQAADLDGDGSDEIIIGTNGIGVRVVDRKGKLAWRSGSPGAWSVDAGKVSADERINVVTASGEVQVLGPDGEGESDLDLGCYAGGPIRVVSGNGGSKDVAIVVACAPSGRKEAVKGLAASGAVRWTLDLPESAEPNLTTFAIAQDRPWIAIGTAGGAVYVADIGTGSVVAAMDDLGHAPQVTWLPGTGSEAPLLVVAAGRELGAFRVVP